MRFFRQDLHLLTGAYALDALEPGGELTRFTRHLNRCQSCASEVRGFREVATAMAFAAATEAPAELRDQVMTAVARTRQLPPEARTHARPRRARRTAPWIPWLSGVVATAAVAVAVFFGFAQAHTQQQLNQARSQNQALTQLQARIQDELDAARTHDQALAGILSAPHAQFLSQRTTAGGVAGVVLDAAARKLIVATAGLPALPQGHVYQLWLIGPVTVTSAGLLPAATAGQTAPVVAAGIAKGDKLGLTVEPAPGTRQPTTASILGLPLPI